MSISFAYRVSGVLETLMNVLDEDVGGLIVFCWKRVEVPRLGKATWSPDARRCPTL